MNISKITVGRLYNLGNYEHIRYELTLDVKEGESATTAITAIEKILIGLKPLKQMCIKSQSELEHAAAEIERMKTMPACEWERSYGHCKGKPSEVIQRYRESYEQECAKAHAAAENAKLARACFDDLGGAAQFKDAKLDWEDYQSDDFAS